MTVKQVQMCNSWLNFDHNNNQFGLTDITFQFHRVVVVTNIWINIRFRDGGTVLVEFNTCIVYFYDMHLLVCLMFYVRLKL